MAKILTEILNIKTECVNSQPVYLRWVNDLGGVDQWLFQGNSSTEATVTNTVSYEKFIDNLLGVKSNFKIINKDYTQSLKVNTTFEKENAEGFMQLMRSKEIQMLVGSDWYDVDFIKEIFDVQANKPYGRISGYVRQPIKYLK